MMTDSELKTVLLEFLVYLQDRDIFLCSRDEKRVFDHIETDLSTIMREAFVANRGES